VIQLKIISGGQTGVDRGALDAAMMAGSAHGGWCPRGRRAEDGVIPPQYQLTETPDDQYGQRTAWNIRDADATLVLIESSNDVRGGTLLTFRECRRQGKPRYAARLSTCRDSPEVVARELRRRRVTTLNIAGPRESKRPGIQDTARRFVLAMLEEWNRIAGAEAAA
jgi:hypothetical protein